MTVPVAELNPIDLLTRGIDELSAKQDRIEADRNYYEAEHPRFDWIDKIRKVLGADVADQVHTTNYCQKAIDAPLAKLAVDGFDDSAADELFRANGLYVDQEDLYRDAMLADTNYVIVQEGEALPYEIVVQDPADVHVEMASLVRGDRAWAVKVWADFDAKVYRAMVWTRTDYYRYVSEVDPNKAAGLPKFDAFVVDPDDESGVHGFEKVPVVPFRRGRKPVPRLKSLRPIQDRINILEICKVIAGIFGASKQRVFFTTQAVDQGDVEASPDYAIVLDPGSEQDGGKASVTEFDHTPLENYDGGLDSEIDRFYEIGDLPKHGRVNPGGTASGEAIKADDGPFVSMVQSFTRSFTAAWSDVFDLVGIETEPVWIDPVSRNEGDQVTNVKMATDAGMPLETALRLYGGLTEDDLRDMRKDKANADAAAVDSQAAVAQAMMQGRDPAELVGG